MTAGRRWCLALLGTAVLLATPFAGRALPVSDSDVSATDLLARVQASSTVTYSGYVETVGAVQLPVEADYRSVADLLGERTRLRVWWRSSDDWRVDTIDTAGETDTYHRGSIVMTWDYEAARTVVSREPDIRLPRTSDLLPPELARFALADAQADEVSRLPAQRIAGREAPGLRLTPSMPQSTIDHVDVWADEETGLPLRVEIHGKNDAATPAMTTAFSDVTFATPDPDVTSFLPPPDADIDIVEAIDVTAAVDEFADAIAPRRLAGLASRSGAEPGSPVGRYGRGLTTLLAVPLWDGSADPLREQLADIPGATVDRLGTLVSAGALNLRLNSELYDSSWLLAGTVDVATIDRAARQLMANGWEVR